MFYNENDAKLRWNWARKNHERWDMNARFHKHLNNKYLRNDNFNEISDFNSIDKQQQSGSTSNCVWRKNAHLYRARLRNAKCNTFSDFQFVSTQRKRPILYVLRFN